MTVLDRSELQASPLADLHVIADQIGLEGFRRLRKADLIDAILGEKGPEDSDGNGSAKQTRSGQDAEDGSSDAEDGSSDEETSARRASSRRSRSTRSRRGSAAAKAAESEEDAPEPERDSAPARRGTQRTPGGRGRGRDRDEGSEKRQRQSRAHSRGRRGGSGQRFGVSARGSARALRCRRVYLRRPGAPLRAGLGRSRERAGPRSAALGALFLARADRDDQRRAGRTRWLRALAMTIWLCPIRASSWRSTPRTRR